MDRNKTNMMVEIARMYYQLDYSQQEIAKEFDISRPSVSRLLQEAKLAGIVRIEVVDPQRGVDDLSKKLQEYYQLKECFIVKVSSYEKSIVKESLGKRAAEYLREIVGNGDIIGTTWGTTVHEVAQHVLPKNVQDVSVVQLNGGISYSETHTYASEILFRLGKAFNCVPHLLPLPAVVDHPKVRKGIITDKHIRHVLELGKNANIALFTVGDLRDDSTLINTGYFTEQDLKILQKNNAVGDICSRFFDGNGEICHHELNARTIGIELEDFKDKQHAILVAGGLQKIDGIMGALRGGYSDVLITDQITAEALLEKSLDRGGVSGGVGAGDRRNNYRIFE